MSKAILVIDMPENCDKCHIRCSQYEMGRTKSIRPIECPLKPVPEKSNTGLSDRFGWGDWEDGFNACIDQILDE